jgi:hypothetical protein
MRPTMKGYKLGEPANFAHVKLDGHYLEVHQAASGLITCTTRHGTELDLKWVPTLKNAWLRMPPCTVLGELWYPGQPASYVKTAIKNQDPQLRFSVFAINTCRSFLQCSIWCIKHGFEMTPYYSKLEKNWHDVNCLGDFDVYSLPAIQHEGFVMKDELWENWRKYKPFKTIDLIVDEVTEGRGQFIGLVGSLVCKTTEGHVIANVSGFTYDERVQLSESDIGRVVEVKYQYVGSQGRLRHPTFVCFRDDKLPDDCGVDQDEDLQCKYRCK